MLSLFLFQLARLVFDLAFDNVIHVAVVAHPSLLKPEDLDVRHSFVDILIPPERYCVADIHREEQGSSESSPDQ